MKRLKKRKVTLDQILVGTKMEGSVDVKKSELVYVRNLMIAAGGVEHGTDLDIAIRGKSSSMYLSLRRSRINGSQYYLNLSGNPITFLRKHNVYGYAEADQLIVTVYLECMKRVGAFPERIIKAVSDMDINLNSLEFATYTIPVVDKKVILNAWYYVYMTAYSSVDGTTHQTLQDLLNVKLQRKDKEHKSTVSLHIMSGDGKELEGMLMAYDKAAEIKKNNGKVPEDIQDRLRMELSLNYGWFRRRSVNGSTLKTLADLKAYIDKRFSGDWLVFLACQFAWALNRTCMFHMWEFDPVPILNGKYVKGMQGYLPLDYSAYFAMLASRSFIHETDKARRLLLLQQPKEFLKLIRTQACPIVLSLDMGDCE